MLAHLNVHWGNELRALLCRVSLQICVAKDLVHVVAEASVVDVVSDPLSCIHTLEGTVLWQRQLQAAHGQGRPKRTRRHTAFAQLVKVAHVLDNANAALGHLRARSGERGRGRGKDARVCVVRVCLFVCVCVWQKRHAHDAWCWH